jgi:hypothetical protein
MDGYTPKLRLSVNLVDGFTSNRVKLLMIHQLHSSTRHHSYCRDRRQSVSCKTTEIIMNI